MNRGPLWEFSPFRLDQGGAMLWRDDRPVAVPPRSFSVLCCLVDRAGSLVTKDELLDAVWRHRFVSESALKVCINELRRVLEDDAKSPRFIETVSRRGYRFIAATTRREPGEREMTGGGVVIPPRPLVDRPSGPAHFRLPRASALNRLRQSFGEALSGDRQTVFIAGEAGIGKTTVLEVFLESLAEQRVGILEGRCIEYFGAGEAFLPLLEALDRCCRAAGGAELILRLRRWAPVWLAQLPGLVGGQELERLKLELLGTTQERMLREFVALLESIATEQPVVLVLEDLHWSDSATLNVIASLARRTEAARLMVLGTYRPVDAALANHPINLLRQDLCSRGRCQELALKPFSKGELRNFLAGRLAVREVPDRAVGWTMRRSQGLPFFVANLVEDWVARDLLNPERDDWGLSGGPDDAAMDIPQRLRALIDQRIDRLDAVEERLLAVASAAGEEWSAALVGAGVEMPTDAVEECCERLASQGRMIAEAGISEWPDGTVAGRYRFLHALYRDVLYQRLPSARLMRLHRRLAERLETAYGEAGFTVAAELAEHFERAGDCPRALRYWSQAAGNATRRYANGEAVACLNRALSLVSELPPDKQGAARLDLLQQRARARSAMDDLAEAIDDFNEILREARERGDAVLEVSTLVEISRLARWTNLQHCVETASEAGERSRGRVDRALCAQAQATSAIARLRCIGWDSKQAAQARDAMAVLRESNETHLISPLVFSYAWMEIVSSNYELASNLAGEGILVTQRLNDAYSLLACRWYQLWSWVYLGRLGATQRCLRDALRLAEASGSAFAELGFRILQARLHEEAGDFAGVLACCNETKAIIEDNRHHYVDRKPLRAAARLSHGLVLEGRAHVKLGHYSTANECLSEARRLIDDEPELADWHLRLPLYLALAEYWLAQGELSRAREFALALHDQAGPPPERTYLALAHALLAEIAMAGRDWDGANRGIERAVEAMHPLPPDRGLWQVYGLVPSATPAEGSETSAPLAAWRVYLTAERLYSGQGRSAEAKHWRERSHAARQRLAASFDPDDPLRATLTTASTGL